MQDICDVKKIERKEAFCCCLAALHLTGYLEHLHAPRSRPPTTGPPPRATNCANVIFRPNPSFVLQEKRDLVTGLKSRTNAGRPNWNKVFTKIKEQRKGKVTVFFCGNSSLGRILKLKCDEFGFTFKKEIF